MKKVMFITGFAPSLINFRGDLIKTILAEGNDVIAVASDFDLKTETDLEAMNVKLIKVQSINRSKSIFSNLRTFFLILKAMFDYKPDYIIPYTAKSVIYGSLSGKLLGIDSFPLITGIGILHNRNNFLLAKILEKMYSIALSKSRLVFFQNNDDLKYFKENILNKRTQLKKINGSGVNIHKFPVLKNPKNISFLMTSRLIKEKGVTYYIDAARAIKKKYPKIIFYYAGGTNFSGVAVSNSDNKLENYLKLAIDDGVIENLGFVSDIKEAIKLASVFVLPSFYGEGLPRSSLESMSCGRAIITTNSVGCRDTVLDSRNGIIVPIKDLNALETAMQFMIDYPEKTLEMGQESRKIIEEKFDVEKVNNEILNTIKNI